MASEFAGLLARFVEVYRYCPDELKHFLSHTDFWSAEFDAKREGDKAARELAASRALLELDPDVSRLLDQFEPVEPGSHSEEFYREAFRGVDVSGLAKSLGVAEEDCIPYLIALAKVGMQKEAETANMHAYFGLSFANTVDDIVERFAQIKDLKFFDISEPSIRCLLRQAHACYLYGFDSAATIMCRAVIEGVLELALPDATTGRTDKLISLLEEARQRGILSDLEWGIGDDVREMGNLAVHDPQEFQNPKKNTTVINKAKVLENTRTVVLAVLGSANSPVQARGIGAA